MRQKLLMMLIFCALVSTLYAQPNTMPFEMIKPGLDVGVVISDLDAAQKFYGEGLGLKQLPPLPIELPGGGTMVRFQSGATVIKLRTFPTAPPKTEKGVMAANGIRLLTLFVKDPEELTKRLTTLGFTPPRFGERQPAGYRLGFVQDPDGNQIELLAFAPDSAVGTFDRFQIGLTVKDAEKAREFYGKTLGLTERPAVKMPAQFAPDTMEYFFDAGVTTIKFWAPKSERPMRTGQIGDALGIRYITFIVKDVDATYKALQARGVKVIVPPRDLGTFARIMLIADPEGNTIEFAGVLTKK